MVYLDYSATTPVRKEVLDTYVSASLKFIGNPNSLHKLGTDSKNLIDSATKQIEDILKLKDMEVIYTSGATEANNMVIKGVLNKYKNRGMHVITTPFEHSSIYGPLNYLTDSGFEVEFVNVDENGIVDLQHLKSIIRDDTILVSVSSVNSEIGILQPIKEIGDIISGYPKCYFHSDMTQSVGKVDVSISNIDFVTFSSHKFFWSKRNRMFIKKK